MKNNQDFVTPKELSYEDFPEATDEPEGMKKITTSLEPIFPHVDLNVEYAHKSGMALHIHVITPALPEDDQTTRFPLIMWVQGSAFHKQFLGNHLAHMIEVAKHGFVVAMVEYRWAPENPFPAQIKDLKTATRFMLNHAFEYHVDPKKYIAWGDSSGGHTVALAVTTENIQEYNDEDVTTQPLHYSACVDYYGPTDISKMNTVPSTQDHVTPHSLEGEFFGTNSIYDVPEMVQEANPISYIEEKRDLPPFLIMHGNKDRLVPFNQSVRLYEALKKYHKPVDFYRLNNSDHASDGFFEPEVLKVTFDFLDKCLGSETERS